MLSKIIPFYHAVHGTSKGVLLVHVLHPGIVHPKQTPAPPLDFVKMDLDVTKAIIWTGVVEEKEYLQKKRERYLRIPGLEVSMDDKDWHISLEHSQAEN